VNTTDTIEPSVSEAARECAPVTILIGDALDRVTDILDGTVQTVVTSLPYFGLRDYGNSGQIGREDTPEEYIANLVSVFAEVRRTLRDDGTLWINIGDTYSSKAYPGLKRKDLIGIPWMLAFALRADGWYLRSEIIWSKPNPMPESVRDRPTRAHEQVFLFSKQPAYFYDADAIKEPAVRGAAGSTFTKGKTGSNGMGRTSQLERVDHELKNARDVWQITPTPFPGAHFATMPMTLADRCIRAGSAPGDLVLDPFLGAATTALAASRLGRLSVGVELNPDYAQLSVDRLGAEGFEAAIF
jgi:DNA modification methylase